MASVLILGNDITSHFKVFQIYKMYNLNTIFERRDGKILCKDFQTLITERNVYIYISIYIISLLY